MPGTTSDKGLNQRNAEQAAKTEGGGLFRPGESVTLKGCRFIVVTQHEKKGNLLLRKIEEK